MATNSRMRILVLTTVAILLAPGRVRRQPAHAPGRRRRKALRHGQTRLRQRQLQGRHLLLRELEARFPFSNEARQGQLDLMWAYYKNREPESAIDQADQFIRENPAHPRIDYAYYIKGLVQFERNPNFLERWFNADLTERPPIDARKSFQAFQTILERFPNSEYARTRAGG